MASDFHLREFRPDDAAAVNAVAIAAFAEFPEDYGDWPTVSRGVGKMAALAEAAEVIVATAQEKVVGAVGYVGPGIEKQEWFERAWPVIRMLVVLPEHRGQGIGRALTQECVRRARRDGANLIALHTTTLMTVALPMYERMGFLYLRPSPDRAGVPYGIWVKPLAPLEKGYVGL